MISDVNSLPAISDSDAINPEGQVTPDGETSHVTAALYFDPHWLAITRAFHSHLPLSKHENPRLPSNAHQMIAAELQWIETNLATSSLKIDSVQEFTKTAPGLNEPGGDNSGQRQFISLSFNDLMSTIFLLCERSYVAPCVRILIPCSWVCVSDSLVVHKSTNSCLYRFAAN